MSQESGINRTSDLLLDYAISLMGAGTHTSRVVHNVSRMADSWGYSVDITIFQKTIMMTLTSYQDEMTKHTSIKHIRPLALNFQMISRLSVLSWDIYDNHLSLAESKSRYDDIMSTPRMSRWIVLFLVACANASFCRLFGGDFPAMGLVFMATLIAFYIRQEMMSRHQNHMIVFIVCAFISSFIGGLAVTYNIGNTPQIALGSSVLFLIPGVPLINSIIDIIDGHVLSGFSRLMNATMLIICIALGLFFTMLTLGLGNL